MGLMFSEKMYFQFSSIIHLWKFLTHVVGPEFRSQRLDWQDFIFMYAWHIFGAQNF